MQEHEPRDPHLDPDAEDLAERYVHRVRFFARLAARRFGLGAHLRDDLISAGYLGLAEAVARRRPDASPRELSAYVSQRIYGAVLDEVRRSLDQQTRWPIAEHSGELALASEPERPSFSESNPERELERSRTLERLDELLGDLDGRERDWLCRFAGGESLGEIAASAALAPGTLRTRFERAARRLRGRARGLKRDLHDGI